MNIIIFSIVFSLLAVHNIRLDKLEAETTAPY